MTDSEIIMDAVVRATGVSKEKMLSRSRLWPIVEARMLFVLLSARMGKDDQFAALALGRNRTTILKTRHHAEDYISISSSFFEKFNKVKKIYGTAKSI